MKKMDVIAIGELNADLILHGLNNFPVLGQEILCENANLQLGSSTAICACVMSSLGLNTGFVGYVGKDVWGNTCMEYLRRYNIDTTYVYQEKSLHTGLTVSLSYGRDRALATYLGDTIDKLTIKDIPESIWKISKHIHIGSYFLQTNLAKELPYFLKEAKANGMSFSLDAGWQESQEWNDGIFEVLPFVDVFLPNESETCGIGDDKDVNKAALKIYALMKDGILVVKQGAKGAVAYHGEKTFSHATYDVEVSDTTGAGDSFNAGFLYAYLNGLEIPDCLKYGNAAGALSTTRLGGTSKCPTLPEVEECIRRGRLLVYNESQ